MVWHLLANSWQARPASPSNRRQAEMSLIQVTEKISSELGLRHRLSPAYPINCKDEVNVCIAHFISRSAPSGINTLLMLVCLDFLCLHLPCHESHNMRCSSVTGTSSTKWACQLLPQLQSGVWWCHLSFWRGHLGRRQAHPRSWTAATSLWSSKATSLDGAHLPTSITSPNLCASPIGIICVLSLQASHQTSISSAMNQASHPTSSGPT